MVLHQEHCGDQSVTLLLQEVAVAENVDYEKLADLCEGYSGDDITNVCRDAAMNGMRRAIAGKSPEQIRQALAGRTSPACCHA
jgi:katanin p60 ATPase-containing subunit A1